MRSVISCVIDGEDLVCAQVAVTPAGGRVRGVGRVRSFLSMPAEEARRAFAGAPAGAEVVLTCPSEWCAVRPIPISCRRWAGAREELARSVEGLMPLSTDDALLGLIERDEAAPAGAAASDETGGAGETGSGYLVGVSRARLRPWLDAVARAAGRPVRRVLSAHMALLGLGLQSAPEAWIIEETPLGAVRHVLRYGRILELGEPYDESDEVRPVTPGGVERPRILRLAGASGAGAPGERVTAEDLAVGAALAPIVCAGGIAPLMGRTPSPARRWIGPAGAGVAAVLCLWAAGSVAAARLEGAMESVESREARISAQVESVLRTRARVEEINRLIEEGVRKPTAHWGSIMPALAEAHAVVPADGFIYRLELNDQTLTLSGEAERAVDVLTALEASDGFGKATQTQPVERVPLRGLETFSVRADRAPERGEGGRP